MIEYKPSEVSKEMLTDTSSLTPLIMCSFSQRISQRLLDAGYKEVHINKELSKALLAISPEERPHRIEELVKIIINQSDPVLISDFEMLFDPRYPIDVIKIFCEKARNKRVAIKWPGKIIGSKLLYAEPNDLDYHEYDCNSYQLRIVK